MPLRPLSLDAISRREYPQFPTDPQVQSVGVTSQKAAPECIPHTGGIKDNLGNYRRNIIYLFSIIYSGSQFPSGYNCELGKLPDIP